LGITHNAVHIAHGEAKTIIVKGVGKAEGLFGGFTIRTHSNSLAE
jgi:hypothetical protein